MYEVRIKHLCTITQLPPFLPNLFLPLLSTLLCILSFPSFPCSIALFSFPFPSFLPSSFTLESFTLLSFLSWFPLYVLLSSSLSFLPSVPTFALCRRPSFLPAVIHTSIPPSLSCLSFFTPFGSPYLLFPFRSSAGKEAGRRAGEGNEKD